jgi:hypothetical protein
MGVNSGGGTISLSANSINFQGSNLQINAYGVVNGNGGTITLNSRTLSNSANSGLALNAYGAGTGIGGTVNIVTGTDGSAASLTGLSLNSNAGAASSTSSISGAVTISGSALTFSNFDINSGNISINATGALSLANSAIEATGNVNLSGITLSIMSSGIAVSGNVNLTGSTAITYAAPGGGAVGLTAAGSVTISTQSLNLSSPITGSNISISNSSQSDLLVNNSSTITASSGAVNILSSSGYNINISGGGTISGGAQGVSISLPYSETSTNAIIFSGNQTFNSSTALNAFAPAQSIVLNDGVSVVGNNMLTMNTSTLNKEGNSTITGNPLVFNAPGAGTIADSSGTLNLATIKNLVFHGENLAILASANIINTGGARTIDLSGSNAMGGTLTMIAGYNFSPALNSNLTHQASTGVLAISGQSSGGSIDIPNVSINTSASGDEQSAGNVLAAANGMVVVGSINASASGQKSSAGIINIIGSQISIGALKDVAANAGAINVVSALPQTAGAVTFSNGTLVGGSIGASNSTGTLPSSVYLGAITAGCSNINITAGKGSLTQVSGTVMASTGILNISGQSTKQTYSLVTHVGTLTSNVAGTLYVWNYSPTSLTLDNINAGILSVSATNGITISAGQRIATNGNVILTSGKGIDEQTNATIQAGTLSSSSLSSAGRALLSSDIATAGGITLNATGNTGITFEDGSQLNSIGRFVDIISNGNITGNPTIVASGGNVSLASAKMTDFGSETTSISATNLNKVNGNISISSAGGLLLDLNANTVAAGAIYLMSSHGTVTLNSQEIQSGLTLSVVSNLSTLIESQAQISSGSAMTISALGGFYANNILTAAGAIVVNARGIQLNPGSNISSTNGNLSFNAEVDPLYASGSTLTGKAISFSAGNLISLQSANITGTAAVTLMTSKAGEFIDNGSSNFASSNSNISVTSGAITIGTGSNWTAFNGINLLALSGDVNLVSSTNLSTQSKNISIISPQNITVNANLTAGYSSTGATGALLKTDIGAAGSIQLTAGGIILGTSGGSTSLTTYGGNIQGIAKSGNISVGSVNNQSIFTAYGGNIVFLANQDFSSTTGNFFVATSLGSGKTETGAGIELGGGTNVSTLASAAAERAGTFNGPIASDYQFNQVTNGTKTQGVIQSNFYGAQPSLNGVNLSVSGVNPVTINQTGGTLDFDANGAGAVQVDGATFNVTTYAPISYTTTSVSELDDQTTDTSEDIQLIGKVLIPGLNRLQALTMELSNAKLRSFESVHPSAFTKRPSGEATVHLQRGEIFLNPNTNIKISTELAKVSAKKGSLISLSRDNSSLRVANCGNTGDIEIAINGQTFILNSGEEINIRTIAKASQDNGRNFLESGNRDKIGRRGFAILSSSNGVEISSCEISIAGLISGSENFKALRHPSNASERYLTARLLKTAAALQTVTGSRGSYQAPRAN